MPQTRSPPGRHQGTTSRVVVVDDDGEQQQQQQQQQHSRRTGRSTASRSRKRKRVKRHSVTTPTTTTTTSAAGAGAHAMRPSHSRPIVAGRPMAQTATSSVSNSVAPTTTMSPPPPGPTDGRQACDMMLAPLLFPEMVARPDVAEQNALTTELAGVGIDTDGREGSPTFSNHAAAQQAAHIASLETKIEITLSKVHSLQEKLAESSASVYARANAEHERALTCPICLELLYQPFIIQGCGHVFCYACLKNWLTKPQPTKHDEDHFGRRHGRQFNKICPSCREKVKVPPSCVWLIKEMVVSHVERQLALAIDPASAEDNRQRLEESAELVKDKTSQDLWPGLFAKPQNSRHGGVIRDYEDWVRRCADCGYEIVDGRCDVCQNIFSSDSEFDHEDFDMQDEAGDRLDNTWWAERPPLGNGLWDPYDFQGSESEDYEASFIDDEDIDEDVDDDDEDDEDDDDDDDDDLEDDDDDLEDDGGDDDTQGNGPQEDEENDSVDLAAMRGLDDGDSEDNSEDDDSDSRHQATMTMPSERALAQRFREAHPSREAPMAGEANDDDEIPTAGSPRRRRSRRIRIDSEEPQSTPLHPYLAPSHDRPEYNATLRQIQAEVAAFTAYGAGPAAQARARGRRARSDVRPVSSTVSRDGMDWSESESSGTPYDDDVYADTYAVSPSRRPLNPAFASSESDHDGSLSDRDDDTDDADTLQISSLEDEEDDEDEDDSLSSTSTVDERESSISSAEKWFTATQGTSASSDRPASQPYHRVGRMVIQSDDE